MTPDCKSAARVSFAGSNPVCWTENQKHNLHFGVEQGLVRRAHNAKVVGSNPTSETLLGVSLIGKTEVFGAFDLGSNPRLLINTIYSFHLMVRSWTPNPVMRVRIPRGVLKKIIKLVYGAAWGGYLPVTQDNQMGSNPI